MHWAAFSLILNLKLHIAQKALNWLIFANKCLFCFNRTCFKSYISWISFIHNQTYPSTHSQANIHTYMHTHTHTHTYIYIILVIHILFLSIHILWRKKPWSCFGLFQTAPPNMSMHDLDFHDRRQGIRYFPGHWVVFSDYEFLTFHLYLWQVSSEVTVSVLNFWNNSWSSHLWRCLPQMQAKLQGFPTWEHCPPAWKISYKSLYIVSLLQRYIPSSFLVPSSHRDQSCG